MGVELWSQGASQKLVSGPNRLGICWSPGAARGHVDSICKGAEKDLDGWRCLEVIEEEEEKDGDGDDDDDSMVCVCLHV